MGTLGVQEMIVVFILALVLFGPRKLPELGRTIGKAITEFRRASNDLKATFEREMQTLERENEQLKQVAQVTAGEIYDHATGYDPDHATASLPPAETAWNPLEPETSASLSTATEPATVGASAVPGAESNGTAELAASETPEPVPAIEGAVPRAETPQHS